MIPAGLDSQLHDLAVAIGLLEETAVYALPGSPTRSGRQAPCSAIPPGAPR